ncbi:U4/U6 small nuclear ribonucleoprotein Prp31 [Striga asiatica]|uniref:U4/U6 small nuclear ribonucleoprotein Prp31 n=1 Tax=Striga asiatica TaxID=4170 RepID=A0A5A7PHZ5_STRAF|nr:U4/U6 small nuclear ribonucleoprotein Prp31 [Striga asiatica]
MLAWCLLNVLFGVGKDEATLYDSFLADLDELSDIEEHLVRHYSFFPCQGFPVMLALKIKLLRIQILTCSHVLPILNVHFSRICFLCYYLAYGPWLTTFTHFEEGDDDDAEHMEDDVDGDLADIQARNYEDLDSVSKYAVTDMRKLANRMQFGVQEESSLGDGLGEGYGMLGQARNGKLRVSVGQSRLAAKVAKKYKDRNYGISGATSGLTSSLAFTPVQGSSFQIPRQSAWWWNKHILFRDGTFSKIKRTSTTPMYYMGGDGASFMDGFIKVGCVSGQVKSKTVSVGAYRYHK